MSILDAIFGRKRDPAAEANKYLNQIPGVGHEAYDQYINRGKGASDILEKQYGDLVNDPTGFINKIMGQYEPSAGYQFQKGQLEKALSNTAAAGGIRGTPQDQFAQGQAIQGLLSQDQQQYLQNVLGRYDLGLGGEENFANRGYNASEGLGNLLGNNLASQGGLAFQGASQSNANRNAMINALIQALGGVGGFASQPNASFFGHQLWGKPGGGQ